MTPEFGPPIDIILPTRGVVPLIVSSPHSGQIYPESMLRAVRLQLGQLRRLEDAFVDRLLDIAPGLGAPLLHARFARAYVDTNREAFEFDAGLFDEPLPAHANPNSAKAKAGLGTIPSRIAGQAIYRAPLSLAEAERRIALAYWPYHHALQRLIDQARARFGQVLLLDCHSMPSFGASGPLGSGGIDFALGDRFSRSCAPSIIQRTECLLRQKGFRVARNRPYAGGHITAHYGQPEIGVHALQIEIRRGLYMDEHTMQPHRALGGIKTVMRDLLSWLAAFMKEGVPSLRQDALPITDPAWQGS